MPTPEDYAANKLKSIEGKPGPRTEAGKARSSVNALRHGLSGRIVVLPSEDLNLYLKFSKDFVASLYPTTPMENEIAQNIADGYWRLKRVRTTEESLYALGHYTGQGDFDAEHEDIHAASPIEPPADRPYPRDVEAEKSAYGQGKTFRDHSKAFVNLSIYEQRIQRGIDRNTKLLRELQAERKECHKAEMAEVLRLRDLNKMKNLPYNPTEDGFVYSSAEIETEAYRRERRKEAWEAAKVGFDYVEFQSRAA